MESWRPDRFCRGPGLGGEGRRPGREVLDADGRLWGTVKWREIEQSWAHGAEGLSGHRWASGCSLCVFPSTELGSPPSHPITTGSVGPEDACQLLQRALSASHLPPTPRPLPPEISKNWKIRSRREVWGKPSLQDDCDVCRNTRVFTEWVLSGWFSLFCSGQNTGNGLRLQLKGWVRGKGGGLPVRLAQRTGEPREPRRVRPSAEGGRCCPAVVTHPEAGFWDRCRAPLGGGSLSSEFQPSDGASPNLSFPICVLTMVSTSWDCCDDRGKNM